MAVCFWSLPCDQHGVEVGNEESSEGNFTPEFHTIAHPSSTHLYESSSYGDAIMTTDDRFRLEEQVINKALK
jgi:hypothetical protein